MYDVLLILCKKYYKRLLRQNIQFFSDLITAVRDLFWHIAPNHDKFSLHGANFPIFFKPLIGFNNQERYKNKPGNIYSKKIFKVVGISPNLLKKSFPSRKSFNSLQQQFYYLIESCIKYTNYLSRIKFASCCWISSVKGSKGTSWINEIIILKS